MLIDRGAHLVSELLIGELRTRGADDRRLGRDQAFRLKVVQRRHELPFRQVARCAEDDGDARLRLLQIPPSQVSSRKSQIRFDNLFGGKRSSKNELDWTSSELRSSR
jgi:hypothetical protein